MSTLHVITHAFLWSLMEVEMQGKRGWMYDSQTQCSGLLSLTWYHIVRGLIAMLTVTFILRPNIADKTPEEIKRILVIWVYNLTLWFVVEDVGYFVVNGTTYRSAPWQSTVGAVFSTILPLGLVVFMRTNQYDRVFYWDWVLLPVLIYMWAPLGSPFSSTPYTPRQSYCN